MNGALALCLGVGDVYAMIGTKVKQDTESDVGLGVESAKRMDV
ncbi:hypothetical protein [Helicobacter bizzozeronii]|nr:hypothetical protein [Helicobacter bizzozeronii]